MKFRFGITAVALVALLAWGCGYRLRGTGSSLPPAIKSVSVPVFKNSTARFELEVKLTRAVIDELSNRSRVRIAAEPGSADAVMEGECLSFAATPVGFTADGRPDKFNITVTASVTLKETAGGKVIFSNPSFKFIEEYEVAEGRSFEEAQAEAVDRIAPKFARSLVASLLEGF